MERETASYIATVCMTFFAWIQTMRAKQTKDQLLDIKQQLKVSTEQHTNQSLVNNIELKINKSLENIEGSWEYLTKEDGMEILRLIKEITYSLRESDSMTIETINKVVNSLKQ